MRQGYLLSFTLTLVSVAAGARAALIWTNDFDTALRRARDEQKLILLVAPAGSADKMLDEAAKHAPVVHSMEGFVLARVSGKGKPGDVVFIDPAGTTFLEADFAVDEISFFAGLLVKLREQTPAIIDAAQRRLDGETATADLILGNVFLELELPKKATELFAHAAGTLRAEKDRAGEQFAEINRGFAVFAAGQRSRGVQIVQAAIRSPASQDNLAEAWYVLGAMRRIERNHLDAIKAFRKAWDVVAPNTPLAGAIRGALEALDKRPIPAKEGVSTASVRVIPPARKVVTGSVEIRADVDRPASRVDFYLDDAKVATARAKPFVVRIDLGNTPRARNVKAVAFDAREAVIGEAATTINDRADAFHVTIISPATGVASGEVTIEADAHVPGDRRLAKLELFWKNARLETFTEPPFRLVFVMPKESGYVRALGTLDDGSTAEDTRLLNIGPVSETVNVQGVTFIATVVDREGKRVEGLAAKDFLVEEEGRRVEVTTRASADEAAVVGIAIDISRSMRPVQLDVIELASALVSAIASPQAKIFLVVFDNSPRMLHPPTSDVNSLHAKLNDLFASGGTTLYDGMIFALQQFQGIEGRRALIVISDGRDIASGERAEAATRLAKSSGVPIYAIVPRGGFATGKRFGNALTGIAESTGGAFFFAPRRNEQPQMLETIRDEVRGQYVLSFVSPAAAKAGTWRKLRVEVPGKTVRTVSGYFVP